MDDWENFISRSWCNSVWCKHIKIKNNLKGKKISAALKLIHSQMLNIIPTPNNYSWLNSKIRFHSKVKNISHPEIHYKKYFHLILLLQNLSLFIFSLFLNQFILKSFSIKGQIHCKTQQFWIYLIVMSFLGKLKTRNFLFKTGDSIQFIGDSLRSLDKYFPKSL
jgi:hypothetical protein